MLLYIHSNVRLRPGDPKRKRGARGGGRGGSEMGVDTHRAKKRNMLSRLGRGLESNKKEPRRGKQTRRNSRRVHRGEHLRCRTKNTASLKPPPTVV